MEDNGERMGRTREEMVGGKQARADFCSFDDHNQVNFPSIDTYLLAHQEEYFNLGFDMI
ncbi:MAG: hypothetical protein ACOYI4_03610 [Christensenellales bacterium]|jgi:hypothetical protein